MTTTANVTIHNTGAHPVDQAAPAATGASKLPPGTVIDERGRKIVVRQLDPLQVYRLGKIMGEAGDSSVARNYASMAASVRELDGEPEAFPNTEREIEAMLQRLSREGVEAVAEALNELESARPKKASKDAAKN